MSVDQLLGESRLIHLFGLFSIVVKTMRSRVSRVVMSDRTCLFGKTVCVLTEPLSRCALLVGFTGRASHWVPGSPNPSLIHIDVSPCGKPRSEVVS